jgi:hypothetical protein
MPALYAFLQHAAEHNLNYITQEEFDARLGLYQMRDDLINLENMKTENTFTLAHNKFSTWTDLELDQIRGFKASVRSGA